MGSVLGQVSQLARHGADLTQNLRAGFGLAVFQRDSASSIVASVDQLGILCVFNFGAAVLFDFMRAGGHGQFSQWGLATLSLNVLFLMLACLLISRISSNDDVALRVPTVLLSLYLPYEIIESFQFVWARHEGTFELDEVIPFMPSLAIWWLGSVVTWMLYSVCNFRSYQFVISLALLFLSTFIPHYYFHVDSMWWNIDGEEQEETDRSVDWVTKESTFYTQANLLPAHLSGIARGTPNQAELYFVGMAPYASQDVFIKETQSISTLFADRFGARGKSMVLANHKTAWETMPLASVTSLKASLKAVGSAMNPEEDLLFLYITTHGSRTHELSVELFPLQFAAITPTTLKAALDESGIKWKVVVISACYAGGFIEPLKDDHTLIMTAADATHTSFGCGNHYDYTYFGEALFKDQLPHTYSFVDAFEKARGTIAAREASEKLTPSNPQMFVSPTMRTKLKLFEQELHARDSRLAIAKPEKHRDLIP